MTDRDREGVERTCREVLEDHLERMPSGDPEGDIEHNYTVTLNDISQANSIG